MELYKKLRNRIRNDEGITGLETAIILIAFVVVATIFAFVVLTTGVFSSERAKETVFVGLDKARGSLEVRGGVIATSTGATLVIDTIQFTVSTTAGGASVPMDPNAVNNRTVIAYRDDLTVDNDVAYTAIDVIGDGDTLLEPGELKIITVVVATDITPSPNLVPNQRFTFEIQTPVGATIDLTRQLPAELREVMQLH
jgi:flagellin FlaB